MDKASPSLLSVLWQRKSTLIAALALIGIITHLVLRFGFDAKASAQHLPLLITLVLLHGVNDGCANFPKFPVVHGNYSAL